MDVKVNNRMLKKIICLFCQVTCTVIDGSSAFFLIGLSSQIKGQPVSPETKGYKSKMEVLH